MINRTCNNLSQKHCSKDIIKLIKKPIQTSLLTPNKTVLDRVRSPCAQILHAKVPDMDRSEFSKGNNVSLLGI